MQILFVCSQNRWRSPTAERIFDGCNGHAVRSAGTDDGARIKVNEGLIGWSDLIFAMERKHVQKLQDRFGDQLRGKPVVCLSIPDDFRFMDEELIDLLRSSVAGHVDLE